MARITNKPHTVTEKRLGSQQEEAAARDKRWAEAAKDPTSHLGKILDAADGLGNYWAKAGGDYSSLWEFLREHADAEDYIDLTRPEDGLYFEKMQAIYETLDENQKKDFALVCMLGWENSESEHPVWRNSKSIG